MKTQEPLNTSLNPMTNEEVDFARSPREEENWRDKIKDKVILTLMFLLFFLFQLK